MLRSISMLGVWVLAKLDARGSGFNVAFLLSFGFFGCSSFVSAFILFWCSSCILHVCLGAPLRFFNAISFIIYKKKKKTCRAPLGAPSIFLSCFSQNQEEQRKVWRLSHLSSFYNRSSSRSEKKTSNSKPKEC
jgi:hypothetical protein